MIGFFHSTRYMMPTFFSRNSTRETTITSMIKALDPVFFRFNDLSNRTSQSWQSQKERQLECLLRVVSYWHELLEANNTELARSLELKLIDRLESDSVPGKKRKRVNHDTPLTISSNGRLNLDLFISYLSTGLADHHQAAQDDAINQQDERIDQILLKLGGVKIMQHVYDFQPSSMRARQNQNGLNISLPNNNNFEKLHQIINQWTQLMQGGSNELANLLERTLVSRVEHAEYEFFANKYAMEYPSESRKIREDMARNAAVISSDLGTLHTQMLASRVQFWTASATAWGATQPDYIDILKAINHALEDASEARGLMNAVPVAAP